MKNNLNAVFRVQKGDRNKTIRDFSNSSANDPVASYTLSEAVRSELGKRKLLLEFPSLTVRLIKYNNQNGKYILATTLIENSIMKRKYFMIYIISDEIEKNHINHLSQSFILKIFIRRVKRRKTRNSGHIYYLTSQKYRGMILIIAIIITSVWAARGINRN
ncbi:hypothetical protein EWM60_13970 [Candidatus Erwinia dacicola]|nr:hypothetical protein [Candidatus Erwinia dacicola]